MYSHYSHCICLAESKKYSSVKEWKVQSNESYCAAHYLGVFDDCAKHMLTSGRIYESKWSIHQCIEAAKKYSSRVEWHKKHPATYHAAKRNGFFEPCTLHMKTIVRNMISKKECCRIAAGYKSEEHWQEGHPASYEKAVRSGWMKVCTAHMKYSYDVNGGFVFDEFSEDDLQDKDIVELLSKDRARFSSRFEWAMRSPALFKLAYFNRVGVSL